MNYEDRMFRKEVVLCLYNEIISNIYNGDKFISNLNIIIFVVYVFSFGSSDFALKHIPIPLNVVAENIYVIIRTHYIILSYNYIIYIDN